MTVVALTNIIHTTDVPITNIISMTVMQIAAVIRTTKKIYNLVQLIDCKYQFEFSLHPNDLWQLICSCKYDLDHNGIIWLFRKTYCSSLISCCIMFSKNELVGISSEYVIRNELGSEWLNCHFFSRLSLMLFVS